MTPFWIVSATFALFLNTCAQHTPADNPSDPVSPDQVWVELMAGNDRFVKGKTESHDIIKLRTALSTAQHPKAIVLTCSDSRVPPEILFGQTIGDLFVVRTAGNVADKFAVGSIEYAVEHLVTTVLVVLGHTKCGAVTAACFGERMPTPNLQAIVDEISPAVTQVGKATETDQRIESAIRENVHRTATHVIASSGMLRDFAHRGRFKLIEAEYQLDTGQVILLSGKNP